MKALRSLITAMAGGLAAIVVAMLSAVAFFLTPFRVGRLLRSVSIPHFRSHGLRTTLSVFGVALLVGAGGAALSVRAHLAK